MRLRVGIRGMFVSKLAMLMSRSCMLLGFIVLAECVVMLRLMMMMRRGVVVSGRLVMMIVSWMLCHLNLLLLEMDIPPAALRIERSFCRAYDAFGSLRSMIRAPSRYWIVSFG